ncbi:MAG: ABC transporter permease [Cyclobacteriaceae bacterium]
MLRNYLLIAFRHFLRERRATLINLTGLSIGLASAVFIILYVQDELGFDSMHPYEDRTWRLGFGYTNTDGSSQKVNEAPGSWARKLKEQVPEVQQTLRVLHANFPTTIENKEAEKSVLVNDVRWTESQVAEVFALELIEGDTAYLFTDPNTIAISQTAAKILFGDQSPLGKTITVKDNAYTNGEEQPLTVTGVFQDFPANSTFRFHYLINIQSLRPYRTEFTNFMDGASFEQYVVLNNNASFEKLVGFLQKECDQLQKDNAQYVTSVFPIPVKLRDLHFNDEATWDYTGTLGSKRSLTLLSVVALLILIIACINYMNLATAKATVRAKEVGIRKAIGSSRASLMIQFFAESVILSVMSVILAVCLTTTFLPYFNQLSGKHFIMADLFRPNVLVIFFSVMIFASLAGGSYPALLLSGFKPARVLKGSAVMGTGSELVRRFLVMIQYAMALALLVVMIATNRQTKLMYDTKLNSQGDQIMMVRFGSTNLPYDKFHVFKQALLQDPEIVQVSLGDAFPRLSHWGKSTPSLTISGFGEQKYNWNQMLVDFDFLSLFDLEIIAGRAFDPANPADSSALIINEAAVKALGKTNDEVIGEMASIQLGRDREGKPFFATQKVIGVVRDFSYETMKMTINPLTLFPNPNLRGYKTGTMVFVKLPKGNVAEKIEEIDATWNDLFPGTGMQYYFVNEIFGRMYKSEMTLSSLFSGFSVLTLLITVFGLYGLSSFAAERRTKEIGIRKIHGASVRQIAWLLLGSFLRIFAIAAAIVIPLSHYLLDGWLQSFQYRVSLGPGLYGLGMGMIFLVTLLTVSFETLKAAVMNPVRSLRRE